MTLNESEQEILLLEEKLLQLKNDYQRDFDSYCKENANDSKTHIILLEKNIKELYKNNNSTQNELRKSNNNIDFGSIFGISSFGNILQYEDLIINWFEKNITKYNITVTPYPLFRYEDNKIIFESQSDIKERNTENNFTLLKNLCGGKESNTVTIKEYKCLNYQYKYSFTNTICNDMISGVIDSLLTNALKYYMKKELKKELVIRNACITRNGNIFTLNINGKFF